MSQKYIIDEETLLDIAKAIRSKLQSKDKILVEQFADMILSIQAINDYYLKRFADDTVQASIKMKELLGFSSVDDFVSTYMHIPLNKNPNETINSSFTLKGITVGKVTDSISFGLTTVEENIEE